MKVWLAILHASACAVALCAILAACGGGGTTAPGSAALPITQPDWVPQALAGNGHVSLSWPTLPGATSYQVWVQQDGAALATLSRSLPAVSATTAVHTITDLNASASYKVWVRADMPSAAITSQALTLRAQALPTGSPSEQPAYAPTQTDLAVLDIRTQSAAPVDSRDVYVTASFALYAHSAAQAAATAQHSGSLLIRGRGNTTWINHAKKSYRLKLDGSADLLGMPPNKHWVLLANHGDKSLLRNDLAFEISRRLGFAYTPRSAYTEVWLNGAYLGLYQLTEHVRTGPQRVNVASLGTAASDDALPRVSGGYLLQVDRPGDGAMFTSSICHLSFNFETPEAPTPAQMAYISHYVNAAEAALYSTTFADPSVGYAAYLNVDSFVDWYIHSELMMNIDSMRNSTYLYKDRDAKLAMGPVWDFDLAMGNFQGLYTTEPGRTTGFGLVADKCWVRPLLQDSAFQARIRLRWQALRAGVLADLSAYVAAQAGVLAQGQAHNFARWPVLDKYLWLNTVATGSYAGEVEYLDFWLQRRMRWLDSQWGVRAPLTKVRK